MAVAPRNRWPRALTSSDAEALDAAIGYLTFDSVEAFQKAFGPHAAEIVADVPNYTNARPIIQIVEVVT